MEMRDAESDPEINCIHEMLYEVQGCTSSFFWLQGPTDVMDYHDIPAPPGEEKCKEVFTAVNEDDIRCNHRTGNDI